MCTRPARANVSRSSAGMADMSAMTRARTSGASAPNRRSMRRPAAARIVGSMARDTTGPSVAWSATMPRAPAAMRPRTTTDSPARPAPARGSTIACARQAPKCAEPRPTVPWLASFSSATTIAFVPAMRRPHAAARSSAARAISAPAAPTSRQVAWSRRTSSAGRRIASTAVPSTTSSSATVVARDNVAAARSPLAYDSAARATSGTAGGWNGARGMTAARYRPLRRPPHHASPPVSQTVLRQ